MADQPTALRLAEWLDSAYEGEAQDAAAELRRLVAENELLASALDKLRSVFRDERMELLRQRDQATAQRDELLEALKYHQEQTRPIERTRAAIAKAEGQQ